MTTHINDIDRDALLLVLQDHLNNNSDPRFYSGSVLAAYHRISSHQPLVELIAIEMCRCGLNARVIDKWLHEPWMVDEFVALCASKPSKNARDPDFISIQMAHCGIAMTGNCYAPRFYQLLNDLMQLLDGAKDDAVRLIDAVLKDFKPEACSLQTDNYDGVRLHLGTQPQCGYDQSMGYWVSIRHSSEVEVFYCDNREFARCAINKAMNRRRAKLKDCGLFRRDPRIHKNEPEVLSTMPNVWSWLGRKPEQALEVSPKLAINAAVLVAIKKPRRLREVFDIVAKRLPVEKREVKTALQRLRKCGAAYCDLKNGRWLVNKPSKRTSR